MSVDDQNATRPSWEPSADGSSTATTIRTGPIATRSVVLIAPGTATRCQAMPGPGAAARRRRAAGAAGRMDRAIREALAVPAGVGLTTAGPVGAGMHGRRDRAAAAEHGAREDEEPCGLGSRPATVEDVGASGQG